MARFDLQFDVRDVADYAARYSYEDDGEQLAIGRAARTRGYYTLREFTNVCRWKTPRSGPLVAENDAAEVTRATRTALRPDTDERERMRQLRSLRGVAWATASVLLHLAYPERFPIWDFRALHALGVQGQFAPSYGRWLDYVANYRELLVRSGVDGRTLDKGLWQWSVEQSRKLY